MSPTSTAAYAELPMDLVEASGLFGALAGGLSVLLPFFLGLATTLSVLLIAGGLLRVAEGRRATSDRRPRWRPYVIAFAVAIGAWALVLAHPENLARFTGAILGAGGVPLWRAARRAPAFGGE